MSRYLIKIVSVLCLGLSLRAAAQDMDLTAPLPEAQPPKKEIPFDPKQDTVIHRPISEQEFELPNKRSKWGLSFFNWASQSVEYSEEGSASLGMYNYLSFDYRINWQSKFSIRPEFYYKSAGVDDFGFRNDKSSLDMGDIYLQYSNINWALLPGDIGLLGSLRAYIPNSEFTKASRTLTQLQARMIFTKPFGRGFEINYHLRPKYWIQTQRGYINPNSNGISQNRIAEVEHFVEFAQAFSSTFGIVQSVGMTDSWYYSVPSANKPGFVRETLDVGTALTYNLGGVSFKGGISNNIPMRDAPHRTIAPFKLYGRSDSQYFLMTYARF